MERRYGLRFDERISRTFIELLRWIHQ